MRLEQTRRVFAAGVDDAIVRAGNGIGRRGRRALAGRCRPAPAPEGDSGPFGLDPGAAGSRASDGRAGWWSAFAREQLASDDETREGRRAQEMAHDVARWREESTQT